MRIKWRDSDPKSKPGQQLKYRNRIVTGYGNGWVTDLPGDDNIYFPRECAYNAIDKAIGGKTRKANPKRHAFGIKIIGKKSEGGAAECG